MFPAPSLPAPPPPLRVPASSRRSPHRWETTEERLALAALVRDAQSGSESACGELLRRYQKRIDGFIRGFVTDPGAVEDLRQSVLIRVTQSLSRLREPGQFEPWLFMMARNLCLDFLRARRRRPITHLETQEWEALVDPVDEHARATLLDQLRCSVDSLGAEERRLLGWVVEGHAQEEIAARLGATRLAVKARLSRLRARLRRDLVRQDRVLAERGSTLPVCLPCTVSTLPQATREERAA